MKTAEAGDFRLEIIAQTGTNLKGRKLIGFCETDWLSGCPYSAVALNNSGLLAFRAATVKGPGIFSPSGALAEPGDNVGEVSLLSLDQPYLNDANMLSYSGKFSVRKTREEGNGIFSQQTLVAGTGGVLGGKTIRRITCPSSISAVGNVVYNVEFSDLSAGLAAGSQVISGVEFPGICSSRNLNNNGKLVYTLGSAATNAVFADNVRVAGVGDTIGGKTLLSVSLPAVNHQGQVAFHASFALGNGLFDKLNSKVVTGDTISALKLTYIHPRFSMNDLGQIAFTSDVETAEEFPIGATACVFTRDRLVAKPGDIVDGRTISQIAPLSAALNNAGQVAFLARLSDQSEAIILAHPQH